MAPKHIKDIKKLKSVGELRREWLSSAQLMDEDLWKTRLIETDVNEDDWRCSVAMLVEETPESCEIIEHYRSAAENGSRPVIKNIDWSDVMSMLPTKGRPKKSDPKKKKKKKDEGNEKENSALEHDIEQLIEASASIMRDSIDGTLPTDFISLIVKCLILRLKNEDVSRRELKLQEEQALKSTDLGIPEEKNKKQEGKKGKDKKAGQEKDARSPKKEKNKEGKKSKSKGKKEKEREIIEDQPLDGPHLYITLTGFYDANLPVELTQIKVPINSIVKISGERILANENRVTETDYETSSGDFEPSSDRSSKSPDKPMKSPKTPDSSRKSRASSVPLKKKKGKSIVSNTPNEAEIRNFWVKMKNNLNTTDTQTLINHIAFLTLPPQEVGDLDEKKVYDQVCNVLFDTHDLTWLHDRYLSAMAIREIPSERVTLNTEVLDELMKSLPPGRMTVGFFLNAMLAQVCHTETILMCEMHSKGKSRNKNKRRKTSKIKEQTVFIRSVDSIVVEECKAFFHTFHPDLNLPEATVNMLKYGHVPTLLKLYKPVDEIANRIHMFRLWEHAGRDRVTLETVRNFLQMLRINTIKCKYSPTYERNKGCSRFKSVIVNDLFDMTTYYRKLPRYKLCPTVNKRDCSLTYREALIVRYLNTDIVAFKVLLHSLIKERSLSKNLYFYEDKSVGVNLQCLNEAYNTFNCMDYVYIDVLDTVLLQFHNRHDKRGIFNDYWMESLTTPVGLRDFCSFIVTENRAWILYEQESLKEQREKKLEELEKLRNEQLHSSAVALDNETPQENMNMPGKERSSEEVFRPDESVCSSMIVSCLEIPEKYGKFSGSAAYKDVENKLFEGYNLGPSRIQINGRTTTFYSTKSSQVRVETRKWLYGDDTLLGIEVVKSGHKLILNKTSDSAVSFHAISASNIVLTLTERNTEMLPLPSPVPSQSTDQISDISSETAKEHKPVHEKIKKSKRGSKVVGKVEEEPKVPEIMVSDNECDETPPKSISYDVKLSWPTGLLLETIPCSTGEYPIYVRQRYVSSAVPKAVKDEKYRCVLSNGSALVFKKNGNIIIMTPNGTIFTCKRYRNQEPIRPPSPPPPPPPSIQGSDQLEPTAEDKEISKKAKRDGKKGKQSIDKEEETPPKKDKKGKKSIDKEEETPPKKDKKGKKSIDKQRETPEKKDKKGKLSVKKEAETQEEKDTNDENKEEKIQREKELEIPSLDDEEETLTERRRSIRWSVSADNQETDLPLSESPDLPHLSASREAEVELPEFCPLNVLEYDVLTPMGEYYTVKDGAISKVHEYFPLCLDTDEQSGEVYIVRTDGTKTFYKQNGNLLVTFPDGTRISTRMIFDPEENTQQNIKTESKYKEEEDGEEANKEGEDGEEANKREDGEEENKGEDGEEENKGENDEKEANETVHEGDEQENGLMDLRESAQEIPIDSESEESIIKSFETVHLGSLVEHPNYANVSFDNKSNITKILMPMDVAVCIKHSESEIGIKLDRDTYLYQRQRTMKFNRGPVYETQINLDDDSLGNDSPLCETTDERGDRFIVYSSGETSYIPGRDKDQRSKVTSRRNIKRYFALSRNLCGREFFPRYVHGEYLFTILERKGKVIISAPTTDPFIFLHKISKYIWDTGTQKWTAKYVFQQEHPKNLNPSNLTNLHYNPYVWLQYRNRPRINFYCDNVIPETDFSSSPVSCAPWRVSGRIFYDITREFAGTIMKGLKKYCDEGVAKVDLYMGDEIQLEPWELEIVDDALKTGKIKVKKIFDHFETHTGGVVARAQKKIFLKYVELKRRQEQKSKK